MTFTLVKRPSPVLVPSRKLLLVDKLFDIKSLSVSSVVFITLSCDELLILFFLLSTLCLNLSGEQFNVVSRCTESVVPCQVDLPAEFLVSGVPASNSRSVFILRMVLLVYNENKKSH